jgi:hypothetical protein
MAVSLLFVALAAWLLLRPGSPGTGAAAEQPRAITPDFTRLAVPEPGAQAAPPTKLAIAPTVAEPTVPAATAQPIPGVVVVKRITPADLQRRLGEPNPPLVWELRSPEAYNKQHIPGSKLVKLNEVTALAQNLDRSQAIVTNCD